VTLNGKIYKFLLDTGATHTLYDSSVTLGVAREVKKVNSPGGSVDLKFYDPQNAWVASLNLHSARLVGALDMRKIGETIGSEVHGIVGMDFLKKHVIQIGLFAF
jgi:hypothetical protein